jgi:DNA polymerase (family X)
MQAPQVVDRVDVVREVRRDDGDRLQAQALRVRAKPRRAVGPVERRKDFRCGEAQGVRRAVEGLDEGDSSSRRRREECTQVVRHDARDIGVDDQGRPRPETGEGGLHRGALAAARIVDHVRARLAGERGSIGVRRDDPWLADREGGREHVAEHRKRELAPQAARGMQPRLALDARERNHDCRHREETSPVDNANLARTLDEYAALLDLAGASYYTARAYRRAADLLRETRAPVAELVRAGRVRELRGIGPGIERRLVELVETGHIAELEELERDVQPQLVALGRLVGLGPQRMVALGRELAIHTADEFRAAAEAGRLREAKGIGPKTERKILAGLSRERPRRRRGLLINRADALAETIARELEAEIAGEVRRRRDVVYDLALVASEPAALERLEASPTVVAIVERSPERALGVTVDGIPVEVVVSPPERYGSELVRLTGSPAYVDSLGELPDARSEAELYARLGLPWCPPELREAALAREPPALVELAEIRGDLHCHTTWSDGKASVEEMAVAARDLGYAYVAICDHTPNVRVVPGLDADALRRQADEIAAANERLAPFRVLRGVECDIRSDGTLDLPDDVLEQLDWVQLSLHAGQREDGEALTRKVVEAMRHPAVRCLSHPKGRIINHRPPNALRLERVIEVALEEGVALETNGLPPRLDLCDEDVRLAVEAGVPIVCSTDAHSVRGLDNMQFAVATARRGWATAADVLNTRGLDEVLGLRSAP